MLLVAEKVSFGTEILRKVVFGIMAVPSECLDGTSTTGIVVEVRISIRRRQSR